MIKTKKLTEKVLDPDVLSGQTLAYLGDAVYELCIRRHLLKGGITRPQLLQKLATHYVSAKAQAGLISKMREKDMLFADEKSIFKRGRNAKSHTKAKNTSFQTYKLSTGFEAVFGYLDLEQKSQRIAKLSSWCINTVENGGLDEYDFN